MPNSTQDAVLAEIRNARADLSRLVDLADSILGNVRGLYRRAKPSPSQPPLPGLVADDSPLPEPGEIARSLPRAWRNNVRAYEAAWDHFRRDVFTTKQTRNDKQFVEALKERTKGRVDITTFSYYLSDFVNAAAATRLKPGVYQLLEPTDERRERIDQETAKRTEKKRTAEKKEVPA